LLCFTLFVALFRARGDTEVDTLFTLDGLVPLETFLDIKWRDCYQAKEYEQVWGTGLGTLAFEDDFWQQLTKAYSKLAQYNYGFEID